MPELPTDWSPLPGPALHGRIAAASALARKKRKRNEEFQRVLGLMGPRGTTDPPPRNGEADASNSKRLVAHMLGDVVLAGTTFDVRLAGGRFCGLVRKGQHVMPDVPALSTLRTSSKELTYRTLSSFSFEGESGTGLREELGLDGRGDSTISIEYSFREDSPHLSIRGEIRSPMLADALRVNQYSPLTLALREVERGETIPVEAWAPDGSTSRATVAEGPPAGGAARCPAPASPKGRGVDRPLLHVPGRRVLGHAVLPDNTPEGETFPRGELLRLRDTVPGRRHEREARIILHAPGPGRRLIMPREEPRRASTSSTLTTR